MDNTSKPKIASKEKTVIGIVVSVLLIAAIAACIIVTGKTVPEKYLSTLNKGDINGSMDYVKNEDITDTIGFTSNLYLNYRNLLASYPEAKDSVDNFISTYLTSEDISYKKISKKTIKDGTEYVYDVTCKDDSVLNDNDVAAKTQQAVSEKLEKYNQELTAGKITQGQYIKKSGETLYNAYSENVKKELGKAKSKTVRYKFTVKKDKITEIVQDDSKDSKKTTDTAKK